MPISLPFLQLSQHMLKKHTRHYGSRQRLAMLLAFYSTISAREKKHIEMLIVRRIISKHLACFQAVLDGMKQYASAKCFDAVCSFNFAISLGDENSRATLAWILITGREGVKKDFVRARQLAQIGAEKGCSDSMGVLAEYYFQIALKLEYAQFQSKCGVMNSEQIVLFMASLGAEITDKSGGNFVTLWREKALELASLSAKKNSKYGLYLLGLLTSDTGLNNRAATMGLDVAQYHMGLKSFQTRYIQQDYHAALRYFHLAAAQGYVPAFVQIYLFHSNGRGIPKNPIEATKWRIRALEGGAESWH